MLNAPGMTKHEVSNHSFADPFGKRPSHKAASSSVSRIARSGTCM